jgi:hypothetical protein
MTDEGEWSDPERAALADLQRPIAAPGGIEAQIVGELRSRGLIRARFHRPLQWIAVAAVVALAFAAGALVQRTMLNRDSSSTRFMLLLYGGDGGDNRRVEYAAWAKSVAAKGTTISGEELSDSAEELPNNAWGTLPTDSLPRGYFIVSTATLQEARSIAATCPHLQHGGRIVIRSIVGK